MTMTVRVGFGALGNRPDEIIELARHGERVGYSRIWFGDHLAQPEIQASKYPYAEVPLTLTTIDYVDPLVLASGIAAATSSISIATGIFLLPMHHPLIVARSLSTLQTIAGGRFVFGVGAGWMQEEFEAVGVPFARRGRRFNESLEILRAAQAGGVISYQGEEFSFEPLTITHRAVVVPLVIGGTSEVALRRAAKYGDGWYSTPNYAVADVVAAREKIEALRVEFGTTGRPFTYYVRLSRPEPALAREFEVEGFADFTVGATELFPRTRVAGMALEEKVAALESVASDFGLVPFASVE